jgi:hypothetical protein
MTNHPAGYALTIHSWENDADNCKDVTLYGLKKGDVFFYLHLLKHFKSSSDGEQYYGNGEVTAETEIRLIEETYAQYPPESEQLKKEIQEILTDYRHDPQLVDDLLGGPWWVDCYSWTRVFDSYTVHYIPSDCEDVTTQFSLES